MEINRKRAAELGRETVQILQSGSYTSTAGTLVSIAEWVRRSRDGTVSYPPGQSPPDTPRGDRTTAVEVRNESTLSAARRLADAGHRPAALNFASAKNPGGGFLSGARAQEESLARCSGLYACLDGNPMYAFHRARSDALYTDYVIYSPDVPVFRDDDGRLLEQPYLCSFITSPAPNAKVVLERDRSRRAEVHAALEQRVQKVLAIAAHHGHEALVLGAWGCGVFGNDCQEVADLFARALEAQFAGVFCQVVFAVLDSSQEERFIGPFRRAFTAGR